MTDVKGIIEIVETGIILVYIDIATITTKNQNLIVIGDTDCPDCL